MTDITFDRQVVVVTGAGGGLGRGYALELARRGARVVVNDLGSRSDGTGSAVAAADATVAEITAAGGEAVANHDSVATAEGGAAVVGAALDAFGTVDAVINNAGILRDRSFANLSAEELRAVIDVHLLGAFHVSQPAFRVMKDKGYGRFLFTSSAAGLFGNFGQANYAAAKMGLVGLAHVLAVEGERHGITSNAIAPAALSRLNADLLDGPLATTLAPELVTPLALYLVSPACEVTHEVFSVGGGRFARVFLGLTPGWVAPPGTPSVEDVRDHLAAVRHEAGYVVPSSLADELEIMAGIDR